MICPKCQKKLPEGTEKCTGCGSKLTLRNLENTPQPTHVASMPQYEKTPSTKVSTQAPESMPTKVASTRSDVGITKVYVEPDIPPTKVADTFEVKPTKVFGETSSLEPIYGWLVVLEGQNKWQQYTIPNIERRFIIGSSSAHEVFFKDQDVEPAHVSIRLKEGKLFITDLDTSVGTKVNGEDISRVELQDGDEIIIGSVIIKFRKL